LVFPCVRIRDGVAIRVTTQSEQKKNWSKIIKPNCQKQNWKTSIWIWILVMKLEKSAIIIIEDWRKWNSSDSSNYDLVELLNLILTLFRHKSKPALGDNDRNNIKVPWLQGHALCSYVSSLKPDHMYHIQSHPAAPGHQYQTHISTQYNQCISLVNHSMNYSEIKEE